MPSGRCLPRASRHVAIRLPRGAISFTPRLQPGDSGGNLNIEPFSTVLTAVDHEKPLETVQDLLRRADHRAKATVWMRSLRVVERYMVIGPSQKEQELKEIGRHRLAAENKAPRLFDNRKSFP